MYTLASWPGFGAVRCCQPTEAEQEHCLKLVSWELCQNNTRFQVIRKAITGSLKNRLSCKSNKTHLVNITSVQNAGGWYLTVTREMQKWAAEIIFKLANSWMQTLAAVMKDFSWMISISHGQGRGSWMVKRKHFGIVSVFYSCLLIHVIPFFHNQLRI